MASVLEDQLLLATLPFRHIYSTIYRDNCQVDAIYTDFSKVFDHVDHINLMSTLDHRHV